MEETNRFELGEVHYFGGTAAIPTATVQIRRPDGVVVVETATGFNPGEAVFKAIDRAVERSKEITPARYRFGNSSHWHDRGRLAKTEVRVTVNNCAVSVTHLDPVVAQAHAYVEVLNRAFGNCDYPGERREDLVSTMGA